MQKKIGVCIRIGSIAAILAMLLLTVNSISHVTSYAKGASYKGTSANPCGYYMYTNSDTVFNDDSYGLVMYIYNDHCRDFYAVATGFVPARYSGGGHLCITFVGLQACINTGPGSGPQGAYYSVYSSVTHSLSEDATADFTNIPGGNLHNDVYYFCSSNC